jgi:hypothetical protein
MGVTEDVGRTLLLALVLGTAALPTLAAGSPAGMVMMIIGETAPGLSAQAEIPADVPIRLGPGAALTFLHYYRCKLVTVSGGTVTLSRADFVADGRISNETAGPCAHIHQLSTTGAVSRGVIMRAAETVRLPVNPEIVFTGNRADKVTAAAVYAEDKSDQPLLRFDLADGRAKLPGATTPLTANKHYVLRVMVSDQSAPIALSFVGATPTGDGSLVVLRVD